MAYYSHISHSPCTHEPADNLTPLMVLIATHRIYVHGGGDIDRVEYIDGSLSCPAKHCPLAHRKLWKLFSSTLSYLPCFTTNTYLRTTVPFLSAPRDQFHVTKSYAFSSQESVLLFSAKSELQNSLFSHWM